MWGEQVWLTLFGLSCTVALFSWITETVYPEMWAVREQFGHSPEHVRGPLLEVDQVRPL